MLCNGAVQLVLGFCRVTRPSLGQRLVFPGSVVRLRRFVHILLVDNELAGLKTNGGKMERAARNKEESFR